MSHRANPPPEQSQIGHDIRQGFNLFRSVIAMHVAVLHLLSTKPGTMGKNAIGLTELLAVPWMLGWLVCFARTELEVGGMIWLVLMHIAIAFVHQAKGARARAKGYVCHSRFQGLSGTRWFPFCRTERRKRKVADPTIVFVVGLGLAVYAPALGLYFVVGAFGMDFNQTVIEEQEKARTQAVVDAVIEQEQLGESVLDKLRRGGRG